MGKKTSFLTTLKCESLEGWNVYNVWAYATKRLGQEEREKWASHSFFLLLAPAPVRGFEGSLPPPPLPPPPPRPRRRCHHHLLHPTPITIGLISQSPPNAIISIHLIHLSYSSSSFSFWYCQFGAQGVNFMRITCDAIMIIFTLLIDYLEILFLMGICFPWWWWLCLHVTQQQWGLGNKTKTLNIDPHIFYFDSIHPFSTSKSTYLD